jgi:putative glutamine amidotransferase
MKKLITLITILIAVSCQQVTTPEHQTVFVPGEKHIVLMHPTVNNLRIFRYLTESRIFPLPGNYRVVGVYHKNGSYDYSQSHQYLEKEGLHNFALLGLEPALDQDQLFRGNALTDDFRLIFENSDGVIFFGGPDIPPAIYGHPTSLLTVITDPHRHHLELSFLFHLLGGFQDEEYQPLLDENPDYSILGICLGMQTMNVATGGTMIQDIPFEVYGVMSVEEVLNMQGHRQHRNYLTNYAMDKNLEPDSYHPVVIAPGSLMEKIAGSTDHRPVVLSSHHQAVRRVGKGWKITATCTDGIIAEALEHEKYPNVIGVQFHPERPKIFDGSELKKRPGESTGQSYKQLYPGDQGENFHVNFWKVIGEMYP